MSDREHVCDAQADGCADPTGRRHGVVRRQPGPGAPVHLSQAAGDSAEFARLSHEAIALLPMRKYTGVIHHIRSKSDMARVLHELREERVLGFDTETRPAFRPGEKYAPSLVQLATAGAVAIFHLRDSGLLRGLREILADRATVKAGLAPGEDVRQLRHLVPFEPAGFVDLGAVARNVGLKHHGLVGLCAVMFGFRVSKGARRTNWAKGSLSQSQIDYAATDAWASRLIYVEFARRGWV